MIKSKPTKKSSNYTKSNIKLSFVFVILYQLSKHLQKRHNSFTSFQFLVWSISTQEKTEVFQVIIFSNLVLIITCPAAHVLMVTVHFMPCPSAIGNCIGYYSLELDKTVL